MIADLAAHAPAARAGICPLCGAGPWASLAMHTAKKHHVGARELKQRLGIPVSHSLTSPEVRAHQVEIHTALGAPAALVEAGRTSSRAAHIGAAGAAAKREAGLRGRFARQKVSDEQIADASKRIDAGERYCDVAADLGVTAGALHPRIKRWRSHQ